MTKAERGARLALLAGSLLFAALAGELVLRIVVGPPAVFRYPQERYAFDPELGHRLVAGQRAFTHDAPVRTNSQGLRDDEHPAVPPAGVRRMLALGDSETFGNGLPEAETWPKQLEAALARTAGAPRWEVLNAGVPGTDTWQHERLLDRLAGAYRFDVVVLALYPNDVVPAPAAVTDTGVLSNGPMLRAAYLLKRSALLTALWEARVPLRAWIAGDPGARYEYDVVAGVPDSGAERGWAQVARSLAAMQARAAQAGARFVLLAIPRRDQVAGAAGDGWNRRLAAIAAAQGIPLVDGLAPLRAAWPRYGRKLFIAWDGHDSALANQVLAEALAPSVAGAGAQAASGSR